MTTSSLAVEKDPAALGFDPSRLTRIDDHFRRYVDDGRLAGWQAVVTRRGTSRTPARRACATRRRARPSSRTPAGGSSR